MSSNKKIKAKGSVLYTVTAVMSVLTILVFAAMTLAASANRRAHNNYANNQTQFTANSVIDLVWDTVSKDTSLRAKINALNTWSAPIDISVDGLDSSMGQISKAQLKCIGDKKYKLTVTAKMLGHENTVSGYYAVDPAQRRPLFEYGLRTYERRTLDNVVALGGVCLGVDSDSGYSTFQNTNSKYNSPIHIKGDLNITHPGSIVLSSKSGMVVQGDIKIQNAGTIQSYTNTSGGKIKYMDMPYIYSYMHYYGGYGGGNINMAGVDVHIGESDRPILVLAQNITQNYTNTCPIYGDLYLLGRDRISEISVGGVQPWNSGIVDKKMAGTDPITPEYYTGGNIYSLGAVNYKINVDNNGIANNIIADNMIFDIITGGNKKTATSGAVVADEFNVNGKSEYDNNGKIEWNGGFQTSEFEFKKGLFVDPENFNCESNATINEQYFDADLDLNTFSIDNNRKSLASTKDNQYWNRDDYHDFSTNYTANNEYHEYKFDLDSINDTDDYILDSVRIYYDIQNQNNWTWWLSDDISLSAVIGGKNADDENVYAEIEKFTLIKEEKKDKDGNTVEDSFGNIQYNRFVDVNFKLKSANEDNKIHLKNKENVISFKLNNISDSSKVDTIKVDKVDIKYKHIYTVTKSADEKAYDYSYGGKYSNSLTFGSADTMYWNKDGHDYGGGNLAKDEYHEYNFSLPEDADEQEYILDSVRVYFYTDEWWKLNNASMYAEIKNGNDDSVYAKYLSSEMVKDNDNGDDTVVKKTDKNFIDVKFSAVNGNNRVYLNKGENAIRFKFNEDTDAETVIVAKVVVNYSKCGLRAVNDKAFDDNGGVIQLDDIDKSVRLIRKGTASDNYTYEIWKADLKDEYGNEKAVTDADFKQLAYNDNIKEYFTPHDNNTTALCGRDGNAVFRQGVVKYVSDIDASDANWSSAVSIFNSSNYDNFLNAVVAAVTYPDSFGMRYMGLKQDITNSIEGSRSGAVVRDPSNANESTLDGYAIENVEIIDVNDKDTYTNDEANKDVSGYEKCYGIRCQVKCNIEITGISDEAVNTVDGNKIGHEENNNNKLVRCEESGGVYKSVTIYRDLKYKWSGKSDKMEPCKIKFDNLVKGHSGSGISIYIDGEEYTCMQGDKQISVLYVGASGKDGLNGVLKSMKSANGNFLVDDRYLMGVSGVRSNGIRDIVETVDEIFDAHIAETENMVYNFSGPHAGKITDKDGNEKEDIPDPLTISDSCTLKGTVDRKINIATHSTGDIYIQLDVSSFNLNKKDIIVNDENGRVNFLIPYKPGAIVNLDGNILTENFKSALSGSNTDIYANPVVHDSVKNVDYAEESKIPDIYFYSAYFEKKADREIDGGSGVEKLKPNPPDSGKMELKLGNGKTVCGYFMLASANLSCDAGSVAFGEKFTYYFDSVPMEKDSSDIVKNISSPNTLNISTNASAAGVPGAHTVNSLIIGAVSCCNAALSNYVLVAYVNPNPRDQNGNLLANYLPTLQYYQAY